MDTKWDHMGIVQSYKAEKLASCQGINKYLGPLVQVKYNLLEPNPKVPASSGWSSSTSTSSCDIVHLECPLMVKLSNPHSLLWKSVKRRYVYSLLVKIPWLQETLKTVHPIPNELQYLRITAKSHRDGHFLSLVQSILPPSTSWAAESTTSTLLAPAHSPAV